MCQGTPLYLATDQTGANTTIDNVHTSSWAFTPNQDFTFGGGLFQMKAGGSVVDDIFLTIYQGVDATGTQLGQVDLTPAAFCAEVSNCGNYDVHDFFFVSAILLTDGTAYYVALTSNAPTVPQSQDYFIKPGTTFFMGDTNGNPAVPQPIGGAGVVPEPATFALMGGGLIALGLFRRRLMV